MAAVQLCRFAPFPKALERGLTDRLEHAKARRAAVRCLAAEQALVDERSERGEVGTADRFSRLERGAAREDREPREEPLLVAVEQLEAPVEGGAEPSAVEPGRRAGLR
jgi:hypothetical protein